MNILYYKNILKIYKYKCNISNSGGIIEYTQSFELLQKFYYNTIHNPTINNNIINLKITYEVYKERYSQRENKLYYTNNQI